jgi:hypothetical protein
MRIHPAIRTPKIHRTFATLFLHRNLSRVSDLVERYRRGIVVGSWFGDIRVPEDGVTKKWDIDACVDEIVRSGRDVLLAAGPCSNVIALRAWKRMPLNLRRTIIDVGSALDVFHGKKTRHFHDTMNEHECSWSTERIMRTARATQLAEVRKDPPEQRISEPDRPDPHPEFQQRGHHQGEPLSRHTKIGRRP